MKKLFYLIACWSVIVGLLSCGSDQENINPEASFTRIYDDPRFSSDYDPLDVLPTDDGGYLLLAATEAWSPYLVKTHEDGQVAWHTGVDEAYVNPLSQLIVISDSVYVVCMNEVTLATELLRVDLNAGTAHPVATLEAVQYPLGASQTPDGGLLIMGYDRESKSSTLHKLTSTFATSWSAEYPVEEDVEETIIDHLGRTGQQLPFFTGTTTDGSAYYFNGFSNYTLSLNFVNPRSGEMIGTLNGFRGEGYVSAAQHIVGSQFALARQNFQASALLPTSEINYQAIANSSDLVANNFPEIDPDARMIVKSTQLLGKPTTVYGTHTKTQRLAFFFYDQETGSLIATHYLGISAPYHMGNFEFTEEGDLLVLAETFLIGRFSRLCLFKLSSEEVTEILQ